MSDQRESTSPSGERAAEPDGGFLSGKGLAGGIGAVVGGLATLAATLGLKDLLQNNPFLALTIFALLAAILIFGFALTGSTSTSRSWPVAAFALALLSFGLLAGIAAMVKGPTRIVLFLRAQPSINEAKPIRFGSDNVSWESPTRIRAVGGGEFTLDLTSVQAYYAAKEAQRENALYSQCFAMLKDVAPQVNLGPGAPKPLAPPGA